MATPVSIIYYLTRSKVIVQFENEEKDVAKM